MKFLLASLIFLSSCASDKEQRKKPTPGQVEQPYEVGDDDSQTGVAALAGAWSGTAEVKGYGFASAVLTLDRRGNGGYSGSLGGLPHSGTLRVTFWDGQWLQGETMGYRRRIRANLHDDKLRLQLPYVGTVVLHRAGK